MFFSFTNFIAEFALISNNCDEGVTKYGSLSTIESFHCLKQGLWYSDTIKYHLAPLISEELQKLSYCFHNTNDSLVALIGLRTWPVHLCRTSCLCCHHILTLSDNCSFFLDLALGLLGHFGVSGFILDTFGDISWFVAKKWNDMTLHDKQYIYVVMHL